MEIMAKNRDMADGVISVPSGVRAEKAMVVQEKPSDGEDVLRAIFRLVRSRAPLVVSIAFVAPLLAQPFTRTYTFPDVLRLECCSPLQYGLTSVINDASLAGPNAIVTSISVAGTVTVKSPNSNGTVPFAVHRNLTSQLCDGLTDWGESSGFARRKRKRRGVNQH
jgi:hypothetical protein